MSVGGETLLYERPARPRRKLDGKLAMAFGLGLLSLCLSLWQLTAPGYLNLYDSGVYLGGSIRLISGVLPYRDFTFVQPPGILVLMTPVALISRLIGTQNGFVLARVVSALVTAANCGLLAWIVRHRGPTAMLIAGAGLALLPVSTFVSSGVRLEPYLICFVLLGSTVVLSRADYAQSLSTRRLILGGFLFGIAGLIKLWALFPLAAIALCLLPSLRKRIVVFVGAAVGTFAAVALPFLLFSPGNFISEVFVNQLSRGSASGNNGGAAFRLIYMTGFAFSSIAPSAEQAEFAFLLFVVIVIVAFAQRADRKTSDLYLLLASILGVAALLAGPDSYDYYGYFTAPFLLGLLGVCVGRLDRLLRARLRDVKVPGGLRFAGRVTAVVAGIVIVVTLAIEQTTFYTSFARIYGDERVPFSAIDNLVPPRSCVISDQTSYLVLSNRVTSADATCPKVIDPYGMWMAHGGLSTAAAPAPDFVATWRSYFAHAQYVVLSSPSTNMVPWDASLRRWFRGNYDLIYSGSLLFLYQRAD